VVNNSTATSAADPFLAPDEFALSGTMTLQLILFATALAAAVNAVNSKLPTDNLFFSETFDDVEPFTSGKWVKSSDEKYRDQPLAVKTLSIPLKGLQLLFF
jgi:hypothetical protein